MTTQETVRPPRRVALLVKETPDAEEWRRRVTAEFEHHEVDVVPVPVHRAGTPDDRARIVADCDIVVVLGGDGTLLGAARIAAPLGKPVLGINLGGLGFLAEYERGEWREAVADLLAGRVRIEPRMMVTCRFPDGEELGWALNDVVVTKAALARMVSLELRVDGERVSRFRADGLIISTPVGSTAYNLAAGGPIVQPGQELLVVTPICPHQLTFRPLVVPGAARLELTVVAVSDEAYLTLDGQIGRPLEEGARIVVERAPAHLRLASSPARRFYGILKRKLGWGSDRVA